MSNGSDLLLRNALAVDPRSPFDGSRVDILIKGERISNIGPAGTLLPESETCVYEADNLHVSPGWTDMLACLNQPGHEYKETLSQLSQAAVKGGFAQVLCHPHTQPVADNSQMIRSLSLQAAGLPAQLLFCGTVSAGGEGKNLAELVDMSEAGATAFSDHKHPTQSAGLLTRALQYLGITGRLLVHTPHDPSIAGDAQMNESEQSAMLGMKGEPELSELLPVVKALEVLRYTSGSLHLQPISSPMALQRIHAVKADLPGLSTGVCLYNFALDDTALSEFDSNLKVFPPLRSPAQRTQLTDLLRQGAIDVLCSGHQAQGIEEKQVEFGHADPGMLGLQTAFSLAVMHLIDTEVLSLAQWVEKTAISPAKILGTEAPVIAEGHLATLTLFDPEKTWTLTREDIPSRAKNSPFVGQLLKGKALGIVQKGRLYTN